MTPPFLRHLCIIIPAIVLTFGNQYQSYSGKDQLELFRKIEEARLNYNVSTSPNETADNGNNSVDTTRESRSQKQIIIIPKTKGEMRFGLPKVYLTAGVATQTRVKGGGGGGSGGWGSGGGGSGGGWNSGGGIGSGSGGGWGGNGGGGGSAGWGTNGGGNGGWGGGGGNAIGFGGGGSGWGQSSGRVTGGGGWGGGGNMGGFGGGGGGWGGGMGGGNGGWGGGQNFGNSGGGGGGQGWGWGVSSGGGGGSGGGGWGESMECDKKAQKAKKKAQKKKAKQKKKQMKKGGGGGGGWGGWDRSDLEEPGWMTERSIKIGSVVNNEYDDAVSEESSNEVEIWPNNSPPTRTSRIDPKPNEQPQVHVLDPESFPFLFKSEKSYPNPPSKNLSSISSEELSPGTTSQDDLPKMISLKLICPENPPKSRALWFLNRKSKSIENCVYVQV